MNRRRIRPRSHGPFFFCTPTFCLLPVSFILLFQSDTSEIVITHSIRIHPSFTDRRLRGSAATALLHEIIRIEAPLTSDNSLVTIDHLDSLHIASFGRFGNHFYSAIRAIEYTRFFGLKEIYIDNGFLELPNNATLCCRNGIRFIHARRQTLPNRLMGNFISSPGVLKRLDFHAMEPCRESYNDLMFPNLQPSTDTLFIHIRSGDLFQTDMPDMEYAQPPIGYYRDVLGERNWSRVVLCAVDMNNPCVKAVQEMGAEYAKRSLHEDLALLFSAVNLVIGRGTFGVAVRFLSLNLKKLYTFWMDSSVIGRHWNCVPDDRYMNGMRGWRPEKRFYDVMLSSGCKNWKTVEEGTNENEPMHVRMG
jgi:hypothetical protein